MVDMREENSCKPEERMEKEAVAAVCGSKPSTARLDCNRAICTPTIKGTNFDTKFVPQSVKKGRASGLFLIY